MNLDETQRKKVGEWIAQGLKLSEIQNRLGSELGINLTYMDARLLVDDLKLTPKDTERPKSAAAMSPLSAPASATDAPMPAPAADKAGPNAAKVSVKVDELARPGAMVSGKVTFSDGHTSEWYIDQTGRLGLVPGAPGYRPPAPDLPQFQTLLDAELSKMGF
jgi:hypothetical protein